MKRIIGCMMVLAFCVCGDIHSQVANLAYEKGVLTYRLEKEGPVEILLEDTNGKFVTYLTAGVYSSGNYKVFWNGKTMSGEKLTPGKYTLVVNSGKKIVKDAKFADGKGFLQFANPVRVTVDKAGRFYVMDVGIFDYTAKKTMGTTGIHKFKPSGMPSADFESKDGSKTNILNVKPPRNGIRDLWMDIDVNGDIYSRTKWNGITVFNSKGKQIRSIRGGKGEPAVPGGHDGALGEDGRLYLRDFKNIKVLDKEKSGSDSIILKTDPKKLRIDMPPVIWLYMGPALEVGAKGALYVTNCRFKVMRMQNLGDEIVKKYEAPQSFKETAGMSADRKGMLYVAERGVCNGCDNWRWKALKKDGKTPSAIYQFFDDGIGLNPVSTFILKDVVGLRDVALSSDRKSIYVLEDGDDFTTYGKKKNHFSHRGRLGKGRLFKYDFVPIQTKKSITVKGEVSK